MRYALRAMQLQQALTFGQLPAYGALVEGKSYMEPCLAQFRVGTKIQGPIETKSLKECLGIHDRLTMYCCVPSNSC